MRALVTGATGFLGSRLAAALCANGDDVRVLVRSTSDRSRLQTLDVSYVEGDVTDRASVERALDDRDVVFHAAASVELGSADPSRMEAINVGGTENVLGAAAARDVLAVHVSSVSALGATGPSPVDESWWNPVPAPVVYEDTKRRAHLHARALAAEGARVRIGLPGGIYGFGDESSMAKLIETFVNYPTPIGYMPEVHQSTVNVDDCADGLLRIAERGVDGGEYILCAESVTFREWFELIAAGARRRPPVAYIPTSLVRRSARPAAAVTRWVGGDPTTVTGTVEMATRDLAFSGERARSELGWEPRPLRLGMDEMASEIRASRSRARAARGSRSRRRARGA